MDYAIVDRLPNAAIRAAIEPARAARRAGKLSQGCGGAWASA